MRKQYRSKKQKHNGMRASIGRIDGILDLVIEHVGVDAPDVRLLCYHLGNGHYGYNKSVPNKSLIVELIERGYDITTLDFKINKLNPDDEEATKVNQYLLEYFKSNL